jgi:hypothetical protein
MTYGMIKKIVSGKDAIDGAGVKLVRVFGYHDTLDFDPFLLLDAFDSTDPNDYTKGFPWHPHRGIETVTYLIHGIIEHGDSLKNKGVIGDGDCQWMTAGSGIIHQEMPKASPRILGAQLWLNMPAVDKMADPLYGDITSDQVPLIRENGCEIRVISGKYKQHSGAFEGKFVKANYLDVTLEKGIEWIYESDPDQTLFIYAFYGNAVFDPHKDANNPEDLMMKAKQAVLFNQGDTLYVKSGDSGIRFILLEASPLNEPIAWGGPIVMNTRSELNHAFKELEQGTFIKH